MTPDRKQAPLPRPEPLPPAEHEKAMQLAERRQRNLRDPREATEADLPQSHTADDPSA